MITFSELWKKLGESKGYREEFVTSQVKRGIPFQIETLLKDLDIPQAELAARSGLTQGVISRAANPNYGNLTLNTLIRIAAGFDIAFIGKFVPFSELGRWYIDLSEESVKVKPFDQDSEDVCQRLSEPRATLNIQDYSGQQKPRSIGVGIELLKTPNGNDNAGGAVYQSAANSQFVRPQEKSEEPVWPQRLPPGAGTCPSLEERKETLA